jgi:hypothetical protein
MAEYASLTKTLNDKGSINVNLGAMDKLQGILTAEDKDLKYRVADSEILKWAKTQQQKNPTAKNAAEKMPEIGNIDVNGLQKQLDEVGKFRRDSGLARGVIDSIAKLVTGEKKTASEIAMEKEIKDLFGRNGDFGSGIIEKDSDLNILNPLSSKGFTQSA